MTTSPTRGEIEAGRRLFTADWQFLSAASSVASLPKMRGVEIAFVGRSNVGKSSLINALTGRHALARTSHTPGRTQELIFFTGPANLVLVDMPGYGYAAASKTKVKAWTALIHAFLQGRANLARVYLLVDARHGLKATDDEVLEHARQGGGQLPGGADQDRRDQGRRARRTDPGDNGRAGEASRRLSGGARHLGPRPAPASRSCAPRSPGCWANAGRSEAPFPARAAPAKTHARQEPRRRNSP